MTSSDTIAMVSLFKAHLIVLGKWIPERTGKKFPEQQIYSLVPSHRVRGDQRSWLRV